MKQLLLLLSALFVLSGFHSYAVTHDNADSIYPEFLIRFKPKTSVPRNLKVRFEAYDEDTPGGTHVYSITNTAYASSATSWGNAQRITIGKQMPLNITGKLVVENTTNVAEYQIFINTPDTKYASYVDGRKRKMIHVVNDASSINADHEYNVSFFNESRPIMQAGKVEALNPRSTNLKISLGHGVSGLPAGTLTVWNRNEVEISDPSEEVFVSGYTNSTGLEILQVQCPQMVFECYGTTNGGYYVDGYDWATQIDASIKTNYAVHYNVPPVVSYSITNSAYGSGDNLHTVSTIRRTEGLLVQKASEDYTSSGQGIQGYTVSPTYKYVCHPQLTYLNNQWVVVPNVCRFYMASGPRTVIESTAYQTINTTWNDWIADNSTESNRAVCVSQTFNYDATMWLTNVTKTYNTSRRGSSSSFFKEEGYESRGSQSVPEIFFKRWVISNYGESETQTTSVNYNYYDTYNADDLHGDHMKVSQISSPYHVSASFTYYDNFESFGMPKQITNSLNSSSVGKILTEFEYTNNWDGGKTLPRTIVRKSISSQGEKTIYRAEYDYSDSYISGVVRTNNLMPVWITKCTVYSSATNKLRTITKQYREDAGRRFKRLPYALERPDGSKEVYVHELGQATSTSQGFFTQFSRDDDDGKAMRTIRITGLASNASGSLTLASWSDVDVHGGNRQFDLDATYLVANWSTAEISVTDQQGRLISRETQVYDPSNGGSSGWAFASRAVWRYDAAGNMIEKRVQDLVNGTQVERVVYEAQYTDVNGGSETYSSISFDNTLNAGTHATGRLQYERAGDGVIKKYSYDDLGRVIMIKSLEPPSVASVASVAASKILLLYDADNRITNKVVGDACFVTGASGTREIQRATNSMSWYWKYDVSGRVTSVVEPGWYKTDYEYFPSIGTITETRKSRDDDPDLRRTVTIAYSGDLLRSKSGNSIVSEFYTHSYVDLNDGACLKEGRYVASDDDSSPMYNIVYKDWIGRVVKTVSSNPTSVGICETTNVYNSLGQLERISIQDIADKIMRYDMCGRLSLYGLDVSGNHDLELNSATDRAGSQSADIRMAGGGPDQYYASRTDKTIYMQAGSDAGVRISTETARLNGFPTTSLALAGGGTITATLQSETISLDANNNGITNQTYIGRASAITVAQSRSAAASDADQSVYRNGKCVYSIKPGGIRVDYSYDEADRMCSFTDRKGTTRYLFRSKTAEIEYVHNPDDTWIQYGYDTAGRVVLIKTFDVPSSTQPADTAAGKCIRYGYNLRGQVTKVWGDVPHPVQNIYHEESDGHNVTFAGLLKQELTFNEGVSWTNATWPPNRGTANTRTFEYYRENRLLSKESQQKDAAPSNDVFVACQYDRLGRLTTRTTSRGVVTSYAYVPGSGELGSVVYSGAGAGTPSVTNTYNRIGALATITDGTGTRSVHYRASDGQMDYVDLPSATYGAGLRMSSQFDALNLPSGFSIQVGGQTIQSSSTYLPGSGLLHEIATPIGSFDYSYIPNTAIVGSMTGPVCGPGAFQVNQTPADHNDRLNSLAYSVGTKTLASFGYTYYDDNQCLKEIQGTGQLFETYGQGLGVEIKYNARNEIQRVAAWPLADGHASASTELPGRRFGFEYDNSGNRTTVTNGLTDSVKYQPNRLGQYESRSNMAHLQFSSIAKSGSSPGIQIRLPGANQNWQTMYYQKTNVLHATPGATLGDLYCYGELDRTTNTALLLEMLATASQAGCTTSVTNRVRLKPSMESFVHDADGNLTSDGLWNYVYDGENRLVQMETKTNLDVSIPRVRLVYAYDYLGRRVRKDVYSMSGTSATLTDARRFIYSGMNMIAECRPDGGGGLVLMRSFYWGIDMGGGIGGLLGMTVRQDQASPVSLCAIHDGQGNVVGLVNRATGQLDAQYEYSPFGELIRSAGPLAEENPFRFSTKYHDQETQLLNFGFRYYSPDLGRFINQDPKDNPGWAVLTGAGAGGGGHPYAFVGNNPFNVIDPHGLADMDVVLVAPGGSGGGNSISYGGGSLSGGLSGGGSFGYLNFLWGENSAARSQYSAGVGYGGTVNGIVVGSMVGGKASHFTQSLAQNITAFKIGVAHGFIDFSIDILAMAEMTQASMPMNLLMGRGLTPHADEARAWVEEQVNPITVNFTPEQANFYGAGWFVGDFVPNLIPIGGLEVGAEKLIARAQLALIKRFPVTGKDIGKGLGRLLSRAFPKAAKTGPNLKHLDEVLEEAARLEKQWPQQLQALEQSGQPLAALTSNVKGGLQKLSNSSGVHHGELSRRFHQIKARGDTPGAKQNNWIDDATGDVLDGNRNYIGNVFDDF